MSQTGELASPLDPSEIIARQKQRRTDCLHMILESTATRKLIVAGAGTGKTFTFSKMLALKPEGNNLAMTFIRRLVEDMTGKLSKIAEVKTFHGYCMKVLHEKHGRVNLVDYLTKIIERDTELLEEDMQDFDLKIQMLDEASPELLFYLLRGDYYEAVGFNDAVYRLLKLIQESPEIVPKFDQIVIDEYQDFNPLEVAFIKELEGKGPILIVGDDDQAVYPGRGASSQHLRNLFSSGDYAIFELPFCSRCTEPIVVATNEIIKQAHKRGYLKARISKPYECFIEEKGADSAKYPKIIHVQCTLGNVIPKYVLSEIKRIDPAEIEESHQENYPTVLIIGQAHYLDEAYKQLKDHFPYISHSPSSDITFTIGDGYEQLLARQESNLGWRILVERFLDESFLRTVVVESQQGRAVMDLLDKEFVAYHLKIVEMLRVLRSGVELTEAQLQELKQLIGAEAESVIAQFMPSEAKPAEEKDKTKPTILLTSFVGCKGLSAGHVFIIGANNGSIPSDGKRIQDIEICKFIVALTRTRKSCHIVSNKWLIAPFDRKKKYQPEFQRSEFLSWIPRELIEDRGSLKASDLR